MTLASPALLRVLIGIYPIVCRRRSVDAYRMADITPTDSGTTPDPPSGEDLNTSTTAATLEPETADSGPHYRQGLVRPRDERMVAGVARGLAATWGTPLWLVRVGFVIATALAGLGVVLYLLGWLLMPGEGEPESVAQRIVRRMNVQPTWVGFILLMAGALILAGIAGISGGVLVAAGLLVGGYVLYRGDFTLPESAPRQTVPGSPPPAYVYQQATRPAKPPRPRSYLGRLTVGAMLVTLGAMGALDAVDVASPTSRHYAAAAVLAIGAGLLVGTIIGRSRGLIFLGLLLLPVLAVAAITDFRFGTHFDSLDLRPLTVEEIESAYALDAGHLHLDFRDVDFSGQNVAIDVDLGVGNLFVEVPPTVTLEVAANTRLGDANVAGQWSSGLGAEVIRTIQGTDTDGGTLVVDADLKMGSISIYRSGQDDGGFFGSEVPGFPIAPGLLESLHDDGLISEDSGLVNLGDGSFGVIPRNAREIPEGYWVDGHLHLDLSNISMDGEIVTTFHGGGTVTLAVANDAALFINSIGPIEGVAGAWRDSGEFTRYELPGTGPQIFIEGYGPQIRVER